MRFTIVCSPGTLFLALLSAGLPMAGAENTYGKLPLSFEANQGQTDARVTFLSRAPGYTFFVTSDEAVFAGRDGSVERMKLLGANSKLRFEPLDRQPGISNYFIGNDPSKWRTNVPNYGKVALREVYPGIDLVFYGGIERQLEYDWVVAPGADPKRIRVKWEGSRQVTKNAGGDLVLSSSLVQQKPVILQEGKRLEGGYAVRGREVGFELAKYDASKPLVIDPVLAYSTYLGGGLIDQGSGIAVDGSGNAYVAGLTDSIDFPNGNSFQTSYGGGNFDAFVTKINAAGSGRVYSTFLGGDVTDQATGIALDGAGNAYVTGYTNSFNFPTVKAIQGAFAVGAQDAFVTKINAAGSALVYSTYLGGGGTDLGQGIAVDSAGNTYVTGYTNSSDFPTASALHGSNGGGYDAFVTKINAAGSAYLYSTYLGGSGDEFGQGIAVDGAGNAYVTGSTYSANFPTTNPLQPNFGGFTDVFVTKINAAGSADVYSTYLGGSAADVGQGIAADAAGNAYVTGYTLSNNFPTANALQIAHGGSANDAFVSKINAAGSALVYSTYVGGSGDDRGIGITLDNAGNAYVTGSTGSSDFPVTNSVQGSNGGGLDAFVSEINAAGSAYVYSTYAGGSGDDFGSGIAVDASGRTYVTGTAGSINFPTVIPAQIAYGGFNDAFVLSISAAVQFPSATHFVPVTPCRIADTRTPNGPFGGPAITGSTARDFVIPNSVCGIPPNAAAYSLNVAVAPSGMLGYLTLWPSGQPQPVAATLNSTDGRVRSNAAIVPAGVNGAVSVFATDTTDVILDINGYFVAGSNPAALAFYPLPPCRIADTRDPVGLLGGPSLAAQSTRSFPILGSSCGLPVNAQAYALNFAAVPKGSTLGFLTAWPAGQQRPLAASLNDPTGTVLSNAVIVPAGLGGAVNVFATDATDLVIDVSGYFAPPGPGGLSLYAVTPCRVLDSRLPAGSLPFGMSRDVSVAGGSCGVPATAQAYVFNATVVPPGFLGYITMWPQGQTQPRTAVLNDYDGTITNNMAIVPTTTGSISVFPSDLTHLVLDISGYFAP